MNTLPEPSGEILPPNPIRVETGLSRYPVHRLAKQGNISINITEKNEDGELSTKWEVDYSKNHGQPGPLAYKIDTLLINRRIDEATRPIPKIIKLGSLRDICRELGISEGENVTGIRNALRQNAGALISAKIRYRLNDGTEETLEADFTRYSVVLRGRKLPDGRKADAVYIVLNDVYMHILNKAMTRPLDYDYIKCLPPAPQRFYELLSYQMYAAIKNDRPRAKLLYSELCTYAPLVRQTDWNIARPQLARIHAPHKKSGYIAKIDFQDTVDSDGQPDWVMLYQPGPKARAEYKAFAKRGGPVTLETEPNLTALPARAASRQSAGRQPKHEPSPREAELIGHGITDTIARQLLADYSEEKIRSQIEILEWYIANKPGKIDDPAAWLVSAIKSKNGRATPKGFTSRAERQRQEEARQARERQDAEDRRRQREEEAREKAERQAVLAYRKTLSADQLRDLSAQALASADEETRRGCEAPGPREFNRILLDTITDGYIRQHRLWQLEEA